jgi:hypothetical protein
MTKVVRYRCDLCRKYVKSSKEQVLKHEEEKCFFNPITKSCASCSNHHSFLISPGISSPEKYEKKKYGNKCDVYGVLSKLKTQCVHYKTKE